ncbi:MAG: ABC transporter ATP-binding protein [Frankiales bacterium]|nr:ABC transporter ATP-binding protein [Frankiales bacterium]
MNEELSVNNRLSAVLALALVLGASVTGSGSPAAAVGPAFTTTPLVFTVDVGPAQARRTCKIVGDLRVPAGMGPGRPAPGAVLATNGFGGAKDNAGPNGNGSYAARFAEQGYVTLSYSGLGFGGSSCSIYVDDPAYDGQAGSQLVSFLGGAKGIATNNGAPFDIAGLVRLDAKGSDGKPHANDPRVAMLGGSYGGQIQFAVASIDPRVDALAPTYTWNDLGYSLTPNNAGGSGTRVTSEVPGVWKQGWQALFFGLGVAGPALYPGNEPGTCGGYAPWICQAVAEEATLGYPSAATLAKVKDVSVGYYAQKIKIPVLFSQGQRDSLFTIAEAVATYDQLRKQGNTVRMVWQSWGHTVGDPVAGELDTGTLAPGSARLTDTYQGRIITDWMAHWLKDAPTDLGPAVRYFRDYAYTAPTNTGDKAAALRAATAAYGSAPSYPVGRATPFSLSAGTALVAPGRPVTAGRATFAATGGSAPTSTGEIITGTAPAQKADAPGTFATWTGAAQAAPLDVAGIPALTVRFDSPQIAAAQSSSPLGKLQLFAKLFDVAPDGSRVLIKDLVTAARIPDVTKPVRLTLPGIVHRFDTGHRVQLVLSAADATYRSSGLGGPVTVVDDPAAPNVLSLPVVSPRSATPARPVDASPGRTP